MVTRRSNGGGPIHQLKGEMDRLLEDFFGATPGLMERSGLPVRTFPPMNIWQDGELISLEAELPGVKSDDLDVSVVGNTLTLKGRRGESTADGVAFHRRERQVGEFTRVVRLPVEVNPDSVQAALKDGVLRITLEKAESAKPRKIQVSAD